jgi:hypothetical protein
MKYPKPPPNNDPPKGIDSALEVRIRAIFKKYNAIKVYTEKDEKSLAVVKS